MGFIFVFCCCSVHAHTHTQITSLTHDTSLRHSTSLTLTHSMGGLVVKELLARGWTSPPSSCPAQHAIAHHTIGTVFYSTPHHGTWLADVGWKLRFFGASPAKALAHVRPGRHLEVGGIRGGRCVGRGVVMWLGGCMLMCVWYVFERVVVLIHE